MRILYLTSDWSPHDERFLTALAKTQHEILFARLAPTRAVPPLEGTQEITFKDKTGRVPRRNAERVKLLRAILNSRQPDIIHAGPVHGPAWLAARAGANPLVTMSWGSDLLHAVNHSFFTWLNARYTLRHSSVLVGDCQAVAEKARRMQFPRDRIYLFPWGVDLDHFTPVGNTTLREKLDWERNFVFLSNRSMEPIYGVDVLLGAFAQAVKINPGLRLMLYGRGSMELKLKEIAEASGLKEKIYFGGYASREDLPGIYRSADVFVTASHCDGSSVSLLEALACGIPALVSAIPGNLEWVADGGEGWVFKDNDSKELAIKMVACSQTERLKDLKQNARHLVEEKANWRVNFPILLEAYERAIQDDQQYPRRRSSRA